MTRKIYTAPAGTGTAVRGKTLPELLYEAAEQYPNRRALNQPADLGWIPFSIGDFKRHAEETAFGLRDIGLKKGDRVALYMESDVRFCVADMGCLLSGIIDVPIYLTHGPDQIQYVIAHSEAAAVMVSTIKHLHEIREVLRECPTVRHVIVANIAEEEILPDLPSQISTYTLGDIRAKGRHYRAQAGAVEGLLESILPEDLATIIYTSGTTGTPKGVMLSHENISFNALTSFSGLPDYRPGENGEVTISFLPLTHVFARTLHYGFLYYGTSVYFTSPENLSRDLPRVRPTIFASVPRVIEKVYGSILERMGELGPVRKGIAQWALHLGERFEIGREPKGFYHVELDLANKLVFRKWREALGGNVKYIISGGAALSPRLANLFAAAGITVLQGYGLTETSPVISFNRPGRNRAGSVGEPIPAVEVAIAEDGEILTRGPHIMMGYYRDDQLTSEVLDEEGWFHTGDIGEMTEDGHLRITDRKKDLFKLSTGKYVMPQPVENRLTTHPLIEQAVVVGSDNKFCTALIFPDQQRLKSYARSQGIDASRPVPELLGEFSIRERYKQLVEAANEGMDPWSRIKRFRLIAEHLTPENGMLTPTMKVRRGRVQEQFSADVEAMYEEDVEDSSDIIVVERLEHHQHHAA